MANDRIAQDGQFQTDLDRKLKDLSPEEVDQRQRFFTYRQEYLMRRGADSTNGKLCEEERRIFEKRRDL